MSKVLVEDKTCRICGSVDTKNINIFDAKQKALLYKILTIFPITMYESDPLPKNICKKCYGMVSGMYEECQRIVKIQQKWIERVRINQPDHPYVKVLNVIEDSHQTMLNQIKQIAPDFIYKNIRLLQFDDTKDDQKPELMKPLEKSSSKSTDDLTSNHESPPKIKTISSLSFDYDVGPGNYSDSNTSSLSVDPPAVGPERRHSFKEIQYKLESNGCTLLFKNATQNDVKSKIVKHSVFLTVHCEYCDERFPNTKFLAKHQLYHLNVSDRRIFDKKYLDKAVRRGRLIPIGDKKYIRCLNCWKLFEDNRKILEHWSNADCEFFCQICGIEFARNPKQLREHVPEVHGITYKSSRRQGAYIPEMRISPVDIKPKLPILLPKPQMQTITPTAPPKRKTQLNADGQVMCNLCPLAFTNFRAKNSHMRVHKGQNAQINLTRNSMDDITMSNTIRIKREKDFEDNGYEEPELEVPMLEPSISTNVVRVKTEKMDDSTDADPDNLLIASYESTYVDSTLQENLGTAQPFFEVKASSSSPEKIKFQLPTRSITAPPPLKRAKLTPDGQVICDLCNMKFPNRQAKNSHMRVHKGNNLPFVINHKTMEETRVGNTVRIKEEKDAENEIEVEDPETPAVESSPEKKREINLNVQSSVANKPDSDQMQYDKMYNCHPCGKKFSSKTDLFQHKKLCQSNNKFGCRFCLRAFVTSADLQMHIMLMHKGS